MNWMVFGVQWLHVLLGTAYGLTWLVALVVAILTHIWGGSVIKAGA